jgi:iron complex outermembrane receptor protein
MNVRAITILAAACAVAACAPTALSQGGDPAATDTIFFLKGVTVSPITAAGRNSPVTYSELGADEIRGRYTVQDIPALISDLPSATTYSENGNGIGYNYLTLRGFDQRRISVTINGIPQNDPEDHNVYWIDFPDLAANLSGIHVQRGAGSAFYGPAAIGGSVNLEANPFRQAPGITAEALYGFQEFGGSDPRTVLNTRKYSLAVNSGPVGGQYLFFARLSLLKSSGYRDNAWVDMTSYFLGGVRSDPGMTTQFHIYGGPISDGLAYYGIPKFAGADPVARRENLSYWESAPEGGSYAVKVPRRPQEIENFAQPHFELLHEWRISDSVTLSNTLFYFSGEGFFDYDASWADTSMLRIGYDYGIPAEANPAEAIVRATVDNRQAGWLPRVNVKSGAHDLTLGAEARLHRSTHYGTLSYAADLPPGYDPDYRFYSYEGERDIFSLYGHDVARVGEKVSVMAELQLAYNRYGIGAEKYVGNEFSVDWFFVNPRAGVGVDLDGGWKGWLSGAYTSREPRMRNLYAAEDSWFGATPQFEADTAGGAIVYNFKAPLARPEHLLDAEAGAGYTGSGVSLKANFFWMEFTDELVKSGQVDIFGQPVTGNAERSRHAGVELEASVRRGDLLLSGNLTLSENRLVRHSVLDADGNMVSLDGNPVAGFPDFLANIRAEYGAGPATISADGKYVGPFPTDNTNNAERRNSPFWVVNAGLVLRPGGIAGALAFRAEARNIFNRLYFQNGEGDAFFPAAERNYLIGVTAQI